ncbi:uncharacterized protein LOC134539528 [Bacillus rossius redtenbacheri]|uniref:uncharacterized protein LOC134539528 n=1 Tax=Bacillus rossius redtenbacheri TaxID=93214 RepID=UPI002FDE23D1
MVSKAIFIIAVGFFFVPARANEVVDEVNQVLDQMKAAIEQAKAQINQGAAAVEGAVSGELVAAYQSLDATVEQAAQKAAAAGIDITACTAALNATATADITQRTDDAVSCVTKEMTDALNSAEQELTAVQQAEKDVQDGQAALKACDKLSAWKKVKCLAEETAKLVKQAKDIKEEMVAAKENLERIAASYQQDIKACEQRTLGAAESDAKTAGERFVACVVAKGVGL